MIDTFLFFKPIVIILCILTIDIRTLCTLIHLIIMNMHVKLSNAINGAK